MRKIPITAAAVFLFSLTVLGQFNTGGFYFSGATHAKVGFENRVGEFGNAQNSICFGLTPQTGYFIKNRLAVGGAILMDYERITGEFGYSQYSIVLGPNVRYYLPRDTERQVFLYGFGGYGFVPDHNLFKIMVGPGINFFLTERVAFEAELLYAYAREWSTISTGFHNVHDVTAMVGISLFFPTFSFETFRREAVE